MEPEQILQERLERLEAGETLETILNDLPGEEDELLYLVAQIRAIPKPVRNPAIVKDQYRKIIKAAKQNPARLSQRSSSPFVWKWLIPIGITLFLFATVAGIWGGMSWFTNQSNPTSVAVIPPNNTGIPMGGTPPIFGSTPVTGQFPTPIHATNPSTASLMELHGVVQVQDASGEWVTVQTAELKAGQTFRTWALSSAQLVFFDESSVVIGPNTQITIETLNAEKEGVRQIGLFQSLGETHHIVVPSTASASSYVIRTPSAVGEAIATTFQVAVSDNQDSSFALIEGEIAVTGQQTTVSLAPGQMTFVEEGTAPLEPIFWFSSEGEISQIGEIWIVGGEEFRPHQGTLFIGSPQIGDIVFVRGRVMPDGTRFADRIELQTPAIVNRFKILGAVEEIGVSVWRIAGQEIHVNETTQIDDEIGMDSQVLVRGAVQEGGTLLGIHIQLIEDNADFEFVGLVEQIQDQIWTVSGITVITNENTEIIGDPAIGDLIKVDGQVLSDGTWSVQSIEKVIETDRFEFTGIVESVMPWVVDGISLEVNEQTQISPDVEMGNNVHIEGIVLENGIWLVNEILLVTDEKINSLTFAGIVYDTDPWIVNGISLIVTEETIFVGEIATASLVRVYVRILEDEAWQALRVELLDPGPVEGCIEFSDSVVSLSDTEIVLANGITIPREVAEISGELAIDGEVNVQLCFSAERELIFASITARSEEIQPTSTQAPAPEPTTTQEPVVTAEPTSTQAPAVTPEPTTTQEPTVTAEPTSTQVPTSTPEPVSTPMPTPTPEPSPGDDKVTICHFPPGNPDNPKTITVAPSAVDAHLAHGDYLGECEEEEGDEGGYENGNGNGNDK